MAYDRSDNRGPRGRKGRKKVCSFCVDKLGPIDYKDVPPPEKVSQRAREDRSPPCHRHLRASPAPADPRDQTRPSYRAAPLHQRLIADKTTHQTATGICRPAVFCRLLFAVRDGDPRRHARVVVGELQIARQRHAVGHVLDRSQQEGGRRLSVDACSFAMSSALVITCSISS
mgnify:CR=1 FL=1